MLRCEWGLTRLGGSLFVSCFPHTLSASSYCQLGVTADTSSIQPGPGYNWENRSSIQVLNDIRPALQYPPPYFFDVRELYFYLFKAFFFFTFLFGAAEHNTDSLNMCCFCPTSIHSACSLAPVSLRAGLCLSGGVD